MIEYVMLAALVGLTFYGSKLSLEQALENRYQYDTKQVEPFAIRDKVLLSERNL